MDFYLTNLTSGVRLRIPILPDRLSVKTGAMTVALNIIKTGEVKIPRGSMLTGYSWNSTFPGEAMR
ncbi:MAG: peptidoglycan-binding protein, partial [Kiritimatiellae bacterium]|nr:peptidoglycan-binding protein [Kiritimatiellia bacterium]